MLQPAEAQARVRVNENRVKRFEYNERAKGRFAEAQQIEAYR